MHEQDGSVVWDVIHSAEFLRVYMPQPSLLSKTPHSYVLLCKTNSGEDEVVKIVDLQQIPEFV